MPEKTFGEIWEGRRGKPKESDQPMSAGSNPDKGTIQRDLLELLRAGMAARPDLDLAGTVEYVRQFFRLSRELPAIAQSVQHLRPSLDKRITELSDYGRFRNTGYTPSITDLSPFVPLPDVLSIAAGDFFPFLTRLAATADTINSPKHRVNIPYDFSAFYGSLKNRPTPLGSEDGPYTVGRIFQITGLEYLMKNVDEFLTTSLYHPQMVFFLSQVQTGLQNCMGLNDLGIEVVSSAKELYLTAREFFRGKDEKRPDLKPAYWEVHDKNPLLTLFAVQVYDTFPKRKKKEKEGREISKFEIEDLKRQIAQLTDPNYFVLIRDFKEVVKRAVTHYKFAEEIVGELEPKLRQMLVNSYGIEGKSLPDSLRPNSHKVDLERELAQIDFASITPDKDRLKGLSTLERKITVERNGIIGYLVEQLGALAKKSSYEARLEGAGKLVQEVYTRYDKLVKLLNQSTSSRPSSHDKGNKHFVIKGNVFSGAYFEPSEEPQKEYKDEVVLGRKSAGLALRQLLDYLTTHEEYDKTAALDQVFFPNRPFRRPLAIIGSEGTGKTTLLRILASRTNSVYFDFGGLSIWRYPQTTADILDQIVHISVDLLDLEKKPTYIIIDNFLSRNPQETAYWISMADKNGETFSPGNVQDDGLVKALISYFSNLSEYPMLRVVVGTDKPEHFFGKIPSKELLVDPADKAPIAEIARQLRLMGTDDWIPKDHRVKLELPDMDNLHKTYQLSSFFDYGILLPFDSATAGKVLEKQLGKRLPLEKGIQWDSFFGQYGGNIPGNAIDLVVESLCHNTLQNLYESRHKLAQKLSHHFEVNGDTDKSWTYARSLLRPHFTITQQQISAAIEIADTLIQKKTKEAADFAKDLGARYHTSAKQIYTVQPTINVKG